MGKRLKLDSEALPYGMGRERGAPEEPQVDWPRGGSDKGLRMGSACPEGVSPGEVGWRTPCHSRRKGLLELLSAL